MAAVKKVDTVTLKDLAASLAETHSVPKAQANTMLTEMVANVGKQLKKGSRSQPNLTGIRCGRPVKGPAPGFLRRERPRNLHRIHSKPSNQSTELWKRQKSPCGAEVRRCVAIVSRMMERAADQLQPMQMKGHAGLKRSGILSLRKERPWSRQVWGFRCPKR
jgi:hypothetical protein